MCKATSSWYCVFEGNEYSYNCGSYGSTDIQCLSGSGTYADATAISLSCVEERHIIHTYADSYVVPPAANQWEMRVRSLHCSYSDYCIEYPDYAPPNGIGMATAHAVGHFDFDPGTLLGATWSGAMSYAVAVAPEPSAKLRRQFVLFQVDEPVVRGILSANGRFAAIGVSYDSEDDQWSTTLEFGGGAGEFTVAVRDWTAEDAALDVDDDGRFNQSDVDALSAYYDSTEPDDIRRWDFSADGEIDAADAAVLQTFIDAGLSSGVFGDLDGDNLPDCDMLTEANSAIGYELGDSRYRVELDYDLDGDTDDSDRAHLLGREPVAPTEGLCFVLADMNCDGAVNNFDSDGYVLALVDPEGYAVEYAACDLLRGDIDRNGHVNNFDTDLFTNCIIHGGCP
ncbi:MAG: dockerin type I domain-containing protein [Phycisphaerae bacterium]